MKTTKEFPATHSMSTEWFIADEEGNIAIFDFEDQGPVPEQIGDDFWGGLEEIGIPDKDGISSFELTDEQANYMLKQFKPISDFSEENEYDCLVQIKDDEESLKTFINTFKKDIDCCLSHKERIYYVGWFWNYHATMETKRKRIELVKNICIGFLQEYFDTDNLTDKTVFPFYCYKQDYNSYEYLPQRTVKPKFPLKADQIPEENRKKLIHLPVKFSECSGLQIAQYVICSNYLSYDSDYTDEQGRGYIKLPKTEGGFCYILQNQDRDKDGPTPIVLPAEDD